MKWKERRKAAVLMSVVLATSNLYIGMAYADTGRNTEYGADENVVIGFDDLEEIYAQQELEFGAEESDIVFPESLWAEMSAAEDTMIETATPSQAEEAAASGTDSDILKEKLKGTDTSPIIIDSDLTADYDTLVNLGADHTLTVSESVTLTISGAPITTYSSGIYHTLTINGGGTVVIAGEKSDILWGNIDLENIRMIVQNSVSGGILGNEVNVGHDAEIILDSMTGVQLMTIGREQILNINEGGRLEINNYATCGIQVSGILNIDGGEISINTAGLDQEGRPLKPVGISMNSSKSKLIISNEGTITGKDGSAVFLLKKNSWGGDGCTLEGAKGLFGEMDYVLDSDDEIMVGDAGTNMLTEGRYVWNGSLFMKEVPVLDHVHTWELSWDGDNTYHWHNCTASGCTVTDNSQKDGYGVHTYDSGSDVVCNLCSYTRTIDSGNDHNGTGSGSSGGNSSGSKSSGNATVYMDWKQETKADGSILWKLEYADGTLARGVIVTREDGTSYEQPAWKLVNGKWFAFGADSYAKHGFLEDITLGGRFYVDITNGLLTGWQLIDGEWYYFNPNSDGKKGIMLVDVWVDGYYIDKNGRRSGGQ